MTSRPWRSAASRSMAKPFFAHALEAIRRAARFERAAANHLGARLGDNRRFSLDLLAAFHAARSCHHHQVAAADLDIADADHGAARPETAAGEFVRRRDAPRFLNAVHHLEGGDIELGRAADAAQHSMHHAGGAMHVETERNQAIDDFLNLRLFGAFLHDN